MTTTDLAEQVRQLSDDGLDDGDIARRLGLTVHRVQWIQDNLDGTPPPVPDRPGPTLDPVPQLPSRFAGNLTRAQARLPTFPKAHRRTEPRKRNKVAPHGTIGGYTGHKKRGEEACDDCKRARRDYEKARRTKSAVPVPVAPEAAPVAAEPTTVPVRCFDCDWTDSADDIPHGRKVFAEHWKTTHRKPPAPSTPVQLPAPPQLSPEGQAVIANAAAQLTEYRVIWPDGSTNDISAAVAELAPRIGGTVITRHVQAWTAPSNGAAG